MNHHDLGRTPPWLSLRGPARIVYRIRAHVTCVGISSDTFVSPDEVRDLVTRLGPQANYREITSNFGHDEFLVAKEQIARIVHDILHGRAFDRR